MEEGRVVKVGSRKSELAMIQTRHVIKLLEELYPALKFEIVTMTTLGDRILGVALPKIGEKSLFTKDLEEALDNGSVDMVVHSLKDLPTTLPKGLAIGAVLEREDPRDALVLRKDYEGLTLSELPSGSIIGTSSLRRTSQLARKFPHLQVRDIRGNLNTRLMKLDNYCKANELSNQIDPKYPEYTALILANAGLVRMGWRDRISQVLPCDEMLYAVGQGAIAIECRANNDKLLELLGPLNDKETYCRILSERSFLRTLGGGCSAPVAISTFLYHDENNKTDKLKIKGAVWSLDGKINIEHTLQAIIDWENAKRHSHNQKKHKLHDNGSLKSGDELAVKRIRTESENSIENGNGVSKDSKSSSVSCCRVRSINETVDKAETVEIESLITAHGNLYRKCPYSDKNGPCLINIPIGSEVMGKCPYLEQVEATEASRPSLSLEEQLVMLHPKKKTYDINKCPFMANQIIARQSQNAPNPPCLPSKAEKCPFLKHETQNIEEQHSEVEQSPKTIEDDIRLYCGLTKHLDLPQDIVEQCEELGIDLARSLIERGALAVMKSAQDCIRSSAPAIAEIVNQIESTHKEGINSSALEVPCAQIS